MTVLTCSTLLVALGGCPATEAPAPPPMLRAMAAPRAGPQPHHEALWPLDPRPPVARPFEAPPEPWAAGHRGVDLTGRAGQPVRAALPGRIAYSGVVAGRGVVSVEHSDGRRTTYEPLVDRLALGTQVDAGTTIGRLDPGGSHCAPASCLHWGLLVAPDQYRDPLTLLGGRRPVVLLPLP